VTTTDVRIIGKVQDLAATVAREVALVLDSSVNQHGSASIVLAGGRTPRGVYQRIAASHRDDVPWDQVHFYWGDERHVPHDDDRSNYHMATESLLQALPVRCEHVHAMPTAIALERAAEEYERTLRSRFATDWPTFDLVLLGVGEDGHTASLFPGSAALRESSRWVTATTAPVEPHDRLTLSVPAITHARSIFVLATGSAKADAVRCGLSDRPDPRWPVSLVSVTRGRLVWWLDADAAANVSTKDRR
jgi:6-phosphogluconolactonase